jgi:hypothetical protein
VGTSAHGNSYEGVSKIFRTESVKLVNLTPKRVRKLPSSTQLRATWHTDSLDMVVLPSTGASRYDSCCIDSNTSPEYFGYTLVQQFFHPIHLRTWARWLSRYSDWLRAGRSGDRNRSRVRYRPKPSDFSCWKNPQHAVRYDTNDH